MQSDQHQDLQSLDNASNFSSRDMLLMKCKAAIEELHRELKNNQDQKEELQQEVIKLQEINNKMQEEIQKYQREIQMQQQLFQQVKERNNQLEQYKNKFQECMLDKDQQEQTNKQQQEELELIRGNLARKEQLEVEWEDAISTIQQRITDLEKEKEVLRQENIQLDGEVQELIGFKDLIDQEREEKENQKLEMNEVLQQYNVLVKQFENVQQTHEQEIKQAYQKQMQQIEQSSKQANQLKEKQQLQYKQQEQEYTKNIMNLNQIKQKMEIEIKENLKEKEQLKKTIDELKQASKENEEIISQINKNFQEKSQAAQNNYLKEITKLQLIIDDQSKLIDSFEAIMDKEKQQFVQNIENLNQQNNLQKAQINDLVNKNHHLTLKLQDSQEKLNQLSQDFKREQEISKHFQKEIQNAQFTIQSKDQIIEDKQKELHESKTEQNQTLQQIKILMKDLEEITTDAYSKEQKYKQIKEENELLKKNRCDLNRILHQQFSALGQTQKDKFCVNREYVQIEKKTKDDVDQNLVKNVDQIQYKDERSIQFPRKISKNQLLEQEYSQQQFYKKDFFAEQDFDMLESHSYEQDSEKNFLNKFKNMSFVQIINNLELKLDHMQNELNSSE